MTAAAPLCRGPLGPTSVAGMTNHPVPPDQLRSYLARIFEGQRMPADDAVVVADNLVEADLRGVESHGVNLVSLYCTRLDGGLMMPTVPLRCKKET